MPWRNGSTVRSWEPSTASSRLGFLRASAIRYCERTSSTRKAAIATSVLWSSARCTTLFSAGSPKARHHSPSRLPSGLRSTRHATGGTMAAADGTRGLGPLQAQRATLKQKMTVALTVHYPGPPAPRPTSQAEAARSWVDPDRWRFERRFVAAPLRNCQWHYRVLEPQI